MSCAAKSASAVGIGCAGLLAGCAEDFLSVAGYIKGLIMNNIKRIVKKSGSSFFWSMRFLPKAKRNAMYTIYAFCRHLDDIVDGDAEMSEKLELIAAWREELDNIYDKKTPATDIGRKIYKNCMRFKLPKEELSRLIEAISMDIPNPCCKHGNT